MKKLLLSLSIVMPILSACSDEDSGGRRVTGSSSSKNNTSQSTISYNANGSWLGACRIFNATYWEVTTLDISGNSATKYIDLFPSDQCLEPEIEYRITFSISTPYFFTNTTEGQALQIDITNRSAQQRLLSKNIVALYNTNNICGFNDWAIKQSKDVFNLSCFALSQANYDIFLVKDNDLLFLGDTRSAYDGSTPELRPVSLTTSAYHRL